jgi:hypothetical protein
MTLEGSAKGLTAEMRWSDLSADTRRHLARLLRDHCNYVFSSGIPDDECDKIQHVLRKGSIVRNQWELQLRLMGWPAATRKRTAKEEKERANASLNATLLHSEAIHMMVLVNVVNILAHRGLGISAFEDCMSSPFAECGMSPITSVRCGIVHWMQHEATMTGRGARENAMKAFAHSTTQMLSFAHQCRALQAPSSPSQSGATQSPPALPSTTFASTR